MIQTNTESIRLWACAAQWAYSQIAVSKMRQSMSDFTWMSSQETTIYAAAVFVMLLGFGKAPLKPKIERVVKIDIGKQWRDNTALRRASFTCLMTSIFLNPSFEKTLDIPRHTLVCNAMTQKRHQLIMVNIIKEAFNIG